jgi:hypothetical protein
MQTRDFVDIPPHFVNLVQITLEGSLFMRLVYFENITSILIDFPSFLLIKL